MPMIAFPILPILKAIQGFEEELLERAWAYLEVQMKGLMVNTFLLTKGSVGMLESKYYGSIHGKGYDIGVRSKQKGLPLAGFR